MLGTLENSISIAIISSVSAVVAGEVVESCELVLFFDIANFRLDRDEDLEQIEREIKKKKSKRKMERRKIEIKKKKKQEKKGKKEREIE